jgi:Tfp pilus assembly protein PilF
MVVILAGREPAGLAKVPETLADARAVVYLGPTLLGRIYEKKGSRDLARREYEAALKIDPALTNAQAALKKLS